MPRLDDHQWEKETKFLQRRIDDLRFQMQVQWCGLGAIALIIVIMAIFDAWN